ncbi:transposase [Paraburkholderia sp. A1RO-5]|uniref:transposase n=1 Tax=Paraburkholderia sp. A1RO-5 TaxID=3028369 RepID=UPI003BA14583
MKKRRPYPTDVSHEEWYFAAPNLTLMSQDAPQRRYELREMFNALRWIVRAGEPWHLLPNDFRGADQCGHSRRTHAAVDVRERSTHRL